MNYLSGAHSVCVLEKLMTFIFHFFSLKEKRGGGQEPSSNGI